MQAPVGRVGHRVRAVRGARVTRHENSRAEAVADGPDRARLIRFQDLVATPWPNGGGWTREIYRHPAVQRRGQTAWRLSRATIDATGAFSVLPEARRCLLLASDTALSLSIDGVVHQLGYTDAVTFDGGAAVEVIAVSGDSWVLNLMTYGGVAGDLRAGRLCGECDVSVQDAAAIVVLDGHLAAGQRSLGRHDTLVLGSRSVDVRGEATVVRVTVGGAGETLPSPTDRGRRHVDRSTEPLTRVIEQRGK
jgi:uncharacterized protein